MKKWLIPALIAAFIFASVAYAQEAAQGVQAIPEGYTKIQDANFTAIFNNDSIKAIFGADPVAVGGKLLLRSRRAGGDVNLGYVFGSIAADAKYKKLTLSRGGFISYEPQGGTEPREIKISGESVILFASNPAHLVLSVTDGVYTQHDYSAACDGECRLAAVVEPDNAYLNITGKAVIAMTELVKDFIAGDIVMGGMVHVENLNILSILNSSELGFNAGGGGGIIEGAEISTDVPIFGFKRKQVLGESYDYIITSYTGSTKITLPEGNTLGIQNFAGGSTDISVKGNSPGYAILKIKDKSGIFILGTKEEYNKCAGKAVAEQENRELFFNSACIFIGSAAGEIDVKPRSVLSSTTVHLTISLPALNIFNMLSLEQFEQGDTGSYVEFAKAGSGSTMVFRRDDINAYTRGSLSPGILPEANFPSGAWYELGASFSAYVYDASIDSYNHFECNVQTKECFLDESKVMGFERQKLTSCSRDAECSEGQACECVKKETGCEAKRCITKQSCSRIQGIGTSSGSIDVLFIADGYDNEAEFISDAKRIVNNGLLSINPFSLPAYKNKFDFYGMFGTELPSFNYGGALAPDFGFGASMQKQCPMADLAMVLSKKSFRPFSVPGTDAYISMPILDDLGGEIVAVHEFGHAFGNLNDEYAQPGSGAHTGQNCIETAEEAIRNWKLLVGNARAEQIISENHRGCGGDCSPGCSNFFRPTENSIMNDESKDDGKTFNDVSTKLLLKKLNRFG